MMVVTFEGVDGVGKSTQISLLKSLFCDAIVTKEPGGTEFGAKIRELLLNGESLSYKAELFLFLADRAQHYESVIKPNQNRLILSDRGFISGIAYAMANGSGVDMEVLMRLNSLALDGFLGDKFVFLKASENLLKTRLSSRQTTDTIEKRGLKYLMRVQENMERIFDEFKFDVLRLDASSDADIITKKIVEFIR